ncbi:hypothetical protein IU450_19175 [Nocardia abscessus]|uniref:hypothetical protein n=1 Tax=Nocardia abscessus TaxID=120957 RepID=UPI0018937798|nr:hypothetical protein [Nocardia abscessus]MBF6338003.1 hypothetical protein [Nocardia abscessus]
MVPISDVSALEAWLEERRGFEDGHLARVAQSPDGAVTLEFEEYVEWGPRPGDVSTIDVYELVADAPVEFEASAAPGPDHYLQGVETADLGGLLVIHIHIDLGRIRLVVDEVRVRHVATVRRRTEPWVSDEFTVMADARHDDRFWSTQVSEVLGTRVVWRVLGGRTPREAGLDTDGCFLQTPPRLAEMDHGVFCLRHPTGRVTMRRYGDDDADLWRAVQLVAADFDRIESGNCVFDSADWVSYLTTNQFPLDERLRDIRPT